MRVVDCHVHVSGDVDVKALLAQMDSSGVGRMLLLSETERVSLPKTRQNLLATKRIFDAAPDRLSGLAWVNPTIPGIV